MRFGYGFNHNINGFLAFDDYCLRGMLNRGIWIFTDVTKGTSLFMLEKALGPAIDFAEGRSGSGSVAWIIQGAVWLAISSTLTFIGLWLGHEPTLYTVFRLGD